MKLYRNNEEIDDKLIQKAKISLDICKRKMIDIDELIDLPVIISNLKELIIVEFINYK